MSKKDRKMVREAGFKKYHVEAACFVFDQRPYASNGVLAQALGISVKDAYRLVELLKKMGCIEPM